MLKIKVKSKEKSSQLLSPRNAENLGKNSAMQMQWHLAVAFFRMHVKGGTSLWALLSPGKLKGRGRDSCLFNQGICR